MEWSLDELYSWLVYIHLGALLAFVMAHGVSVGVLFALRWGGSLERTRTLLDLSTASFNAVYGSTLVLLGAGIAAGIMGGLFTNGQWWLWVSLALFIGIFFSMSYVRWYQMVAVRHAPGRPLPAAAPGPVGCLTTPLTRSSATRAAIRSPASTVGTPDCASGVGSGARSPRRLISQPNFTTCSAAPSMASRSTAGRAGGAAGGPDG